MSTSADEEREPLQSWIVAVASVIFDIDIGQKIERVVPEDAISEHEARDVAFHSEFIPSFSQSCTHQ